MLSLSSTKSMWSKIRSFLLNIIWEPSRPRRTGNLNLVTFIMTLWADFFLSLREKLFHCDTFRKLCILSQRRKFSCRIGSTVVEVRPQNWLPSCNRKVRTTPTSTLDLLPEGRRDSHSPGLLFRRGGGIDVIPAGHVYARLVNWSNRWTDWCAHDSSGSGYLFPTGNLPDTPGRDIYLPTIKRQLTQHPIVYLTVRLT